MKFSKWATVRMVGIVSKISVYDSEVIAHRNRADDEVVMKFEFDADERFFGVETNKIEKISIVFFLGVIGVGTITGGLSSHGCLGFSTGIISGAYAIYLAIQVWQSKIMKVVK